MSFKKGAVTIALSDASGIAQREHLHITVVFVDNINFEVYLHLKAKLKELNRLFAEELTNMKFNVKLELQSQSVWFIKDENKYISDLQVKIYDNIQRLIGKYINTARYKYDGRGRNGLVTPHIDVKGRKDLETLLNTSTFKGTIEFYESNR